MRAYEKNMRAHNDCLRILRFIIRKSNLGQGDTRARALLDTILKLPTLRGVPDEKAGTVNVAYGRSVFDSVTNAIRGLGIFSQQKFANFGVEVQRIFQQKKNNPNSIRLIDWILLYIEKLRQLSSQAFMFCLTDNTNADSTTRRMRPGWHLYAQRDAAARKFDGDVAGADRDVIKAWVAAVVGADPLKKARTPDQETEVQKCKKLASRAQQIAGLTGMTVKDERTGRDASGGRDVRDERLRGGPVPPDGQRQGIRASRRGAGQAAAEV